MMGRNTVVLPLLVSALLRARAPTKPRQGSDGGDPRTDGLNLRVYNNTALTGAPDDRVIDAFNFSVSGDTPFSAEVLGTLTVNERDGPYRFDCDFGKSSSVIGFLFADDHLVCQTGAYSIAPKVTGVDNPLRKLSKAELPVRLEVYYSPPRDAIGIDRVDEYEIEIGVTVASPAGTWTGPKLSPDLPVPELRRRELQRRLARGWGIWNHHTLLDQVHLPSGVRVTTAICDLGASASNDRIDIGAIEDGDCVKVARPDDNARASLLAYDYSYGHFFVGNASAGGGRPWNVSVTFSGGDELLMTFDLVSGDADGRYAVVASGGALWSRAADISLEEEDVLVLSPWGLPGMRIYAATTTSDHRGSAQSTSRRMRERPGNEEQMIVLPLVEGRAVGLSSRQRMSTSDISSELESKKTHEMERLGQYGELAPIKAAVQAGVAWNIIFAPSEAGPFVPVSRGWNGHLCEGGTTPEWCYITFDWDNIFASYMLSLDAKEWAYSNFIQVIKSKTGGGFVPNYATATDKAEDRTEPPVGARVLLEMYRKHRDGWLVELLFDDLLDWNNWFMANRKLPPLDLITLGGNSMYYARLESGLDNSPMYDGEDYFDESRSQMLLYDVGFSSMVAMEAEALAELADAINRPEMKSLRERAGAIKKLIVENLWDEEYGIFVNKFVNGTFYRRVSPTSFYPMLAGAATSDQVDEMMSIWLFNSSRFCISPGGDFAGNSDDCYWGLPSISADDPAYLKGWVYWRGFVWGPMAQLVYWGLRRYDSVPSARKARKALCKQMASMMLKQWNDHGHICENYGSRKDREDCPGNNFYHWGGLSGFISLLEDGYY